MASNKAVISLTTGLEDTERVTIAFLVAVGAAESGRPTLMFLAKEAVRLAVEGVAIGTACAGCPPISELLSRYQAAGGGFLVCPICVNAKGLQASALIDGVRPSEEPFRCGNGSATTVQPRPATDLRAMETVETTEIACPALRSEICSGGAAA